ncbi:hypothetical protein [Aquamicrobium terrae]
MAGFRPPPQGPDCKIVEARGKAERLRLQRFLPKIATLGGIWKFYVTPASENFEIGLVRDFKFCH